MFVFVVCMVAGLFGLLCRCCGCVLLLVDVVCWSCLLLTTSSNVVCCRWLCRGCFAFAVVGCWCLFAVVVVRSLMYVVSVVVVC